MKCKANCQDPPSSGRAQTRAARDLVQPQALNRMCQTPRGGFQESNRVRQSGMQREGSLIAPLGVNRENQRRLDRLKYVYPNTTSLGSGRLHHLPQFLAKLGLSSRHCFKTDNEMK
jgi:hypothetical protein